MTAFLPQHGATFICETVFLQAALGFFRNGHFNELSLQCGLQVALFKIIPVTDGIDNSLPQCHFRIIGNLLVLTNSPGLLLLSAAADVRTCPDIGIISKTIFDNRSKFDAIKTVSPGLFSRILF